MKRRKKFYEGGFYARFMDRFQAGLRALILKEIDPELRILDVGCGTGNLTLRLAEGAREVVGVDISAAMLETARARVRQAGLDNVELREADVAAGLADEDDHAFDLAISVMVVHEMPPALRLRALAEMARLAPRVLIVDFEAPQRLNAAGVRNRAFELAAGPTHFAAFRDYQRRGGMPAIAREAGLGLTKVRSVDSKTLGFFLLEAP